MKLGHKIYSVAHRYYRTMSEAVNEYDALREMGYSDAEIKIEVYEMTQELSPYDEKNMWNPKVHVSE